MYLNQFHFAIRFDDYAITQLADKSRGEGFARLDLARPWERIKIPVVMMLRDDADKLLEAFE